MKTLDTIFTLLLLISTVGTGISYVNSQALQRRFDVMSCKLDIANARIDLLNGMQVERPRCLDDLVPQRAHKVGGTT